jgi:hypothetical protein
VLVERGAPLRVRELRETCLWRAQALVAADGKTPRCASKYARHVSTFMSAASLFTERSAGAARARSPMAISSAYASVWTASTP